MADPTLSALECPSACPDGSPVVAVIWGDGMVKLGGKLCWTFLCGAVGFRPADMHQRG